jgi:hypothetical protein
MIKNILYRQWLLIIWFCWLLTSCAGAPNIEKSTADQVQERVNLRWQALIHKNWDAAYQFQTPAYRQRFNVRQFQFKFGRKPGWKSVQVNDVNLHEKTGAADVKLGAVAVL